MKALLAEWGLLKDPRLQAVFAALDGEARATRIVGGAVRDALLGRDVGDADLATIFPPPEVVARVEAAGLKAIPTGVLHGTVTVVADGRAFEVTTLRRDIETDGRHAIVRFTDDWAADAGRRDFTMNALYCDFDGAVLDPLGGIVDLKAGLVRFVGEPEERVREDYLRILRFFRFFAWYGRGRPDPDALKACVRLKAGLAQLSAERVWAELKRLLKAPDPARALLWMRTSDILQRVLPESWGIDAIPRLIAAEGLERWQPDPLLRLEAVLPPDATKIATLAERLRLSRAEADRLQAWAAAPEPDAAMPEASLATILYRNGRQGSEDRLRLSLARALDKSERAGADQLRHLLAFAVEWRPPTFPLAGKDLLAAGMAPGPEVGRRLKELEERWIESGFSLTREELLASE